ncbi:MULTISPECIES: RNA polymerase sigma factor [unclassified Streptomyces]|uniref:RNA polymerase sigma factor n=1 Tax=unclassified Streptomyces TaxID=2593676 RepID=UPI0035D79950
MTVEEPRSSEQFDEFFRNSYNRTVRRLMYMSRLNQQDAEDVVMKAYGEMSHDWKAVVDPDAYLWDRVKKRMLDHVKKARQQREREHRYTAATDDSSQSDPEGCLNTIYIKTLMGKLSESDQAVIALQYAGASKEEQARALGVSVGTVRVRLSRAMAKLKVLARRDQSQDAEVR